MANSKYIQKQVSILQGERPNQRFRCNWLGDEVVLVHPSSGPIRVICPQFDGGFCEQEEKACYVLVTATSVPDLNRAHEREAEVAVRDWRAACGLDEDEEEDDDDDDDD